MTRPPGAILIAAHQPLLRLGLMATAARVSGSPVAEAATLEDALGLDSGRRIGLAIIDLDLPDLNGADGLRALRKRYSDARIVVLVPPDRSIILQVLAAGVHGCVPRDLRAPEVAEALRSIMSGNIYLPASLSDIQSSTADGQRDRPSLTSRQIEVLELLAEGCSNKAIGDALGLTEGTVKAHLNAAFRALGVHNRVNALAAFLKFKVAKAASRREDP